MYICWRGALTIRVNRRRHSLRRYQAVLIPPRATHDAMTPEDEDCLVVLMQFEWNWRRLREAGSRRLDLSPKALAGLRDFMDVRDLDVLSDARRRALLSLLLMELVEPATLDEPMRPPTLAPYGRDDLVRRVVDHLQSNLAIGLDMAALCDVTGYSESRLRHLFRDRAGLSISEVMMRLRLDEARRLLHFSGFKVGAIARMVGFAQTPRFNHFFRKRMGCTPSQYVASGVRFGAKWGEEADSDEVRVG